MIIIITALFSIFAIKDSPIQREYIVDTVPITSVSERVNLWTKTSQMIIDNPVWGVGLGNWKIQFPRYKMSGMRSELGLVHFQRPHNDYLWIFAETGIFGLISYVLIFVIVFGYIFKILSYSPHINDKIYSLLMFFGIITFLVISLFSYPRERITHLIFILLMIASVISIYHPLFPMKKINKAFIVLILFLILILLSFSIILGYNRFNAENQVRKALIARKQNKPEVIISEINRAESIFYNIDPMATPISWYRGVANFSLNRMENAFEDFKSAYHIHPNHIHVLNNLATSYEVFGDHNNAIIYYNKALDISPQFEEALINLSAVYYNIGKYEEAYETIMRCNPDSKNSKRQRYLKVIKCKLEEKDL